MEQVQSAEPISGPTEAYTRWNNSASSRVIWEASALRSHPACLAQLHQTLERLAWVDLNTVRDWGSELNNSGVFERGGIGQLASEH